MISRVRGTEDILDLHLHDFVLGVVKHHLATYNFSEIQTPILEHSSLFLRTLGTDTDVVSKEMYLLTTESGEQLCLRPEATASTMRAFLESKEQHVLPWKVFSYGPMFRHERPQKGRWRQFSQINIELIGTNALAQDAQCIAMLDALFHERFNLSNYMLRLNFLGVPEDRARHKELLYAFLEKNVAQLCDTCLVRKEKNILRVFDCKNPDCQELYQHAPMITDVLGSESQKEWEELQKMLTILSVNYVHDPRLVRGLDYYNKTVFEFSSPDLGAQSSFCGGGRYDSLATQLGSSIDYPSVGAAIGMGRLLMLVDGVKDSLSIPQLPKLSVIIPMSEAQHALALLLSHSLQTKGICVEVLFEGSLKSMMNKAHKKNANYVLVIGDEEQALGTVNMKNMQTGERTVISQNDVAGCL